MATGSRVERKKYEKNQSSHKTSLVKKILITFFMIILIMLIAGVGLFSYYAVNSPEVTANDLRGQVSSKIYDQRGELIKELGGQNRDLMEENEIPQVLKDAVLAIEDARFYDHFGVDPIRIIGSFVANIKAGKIVQGGSTITQQLIKLSVFSTDFQDQTLERKAQEAWLAVQIEQEYTKDEILTLYLNKMFYSNNTYGAKTAAKNFFGKDISEINLAEAALLAGIPQAPSDYDPYANPKEAEERRNLVLQVMLERNIISKEDYETAMNTSIESMLSPLDNLSIRKVDLVIDAYLDIVAQEVQDKMNLNIYTDGIEVYTNMNYQAQTYLFDLVNDNSLIDFPDETLQTAVSIIDVDTGQLKAVIGGRKQEVTMGLNRANTLNRSIGSTMKPLSAYGPAIEYKELSTGNLVIDEPYSYSNGDELYNYDFDYKGNMTIREALASSRNIPALKIIQSVGLDNAYAFLQKLDINILNNNQKQLVESNAIGGEVTPIQLSAAYAAISNYGVYNKPYTVSRIITQSGTDQAFETDSRQAMKDSTAYMLVDILKGVPGVYATNSNVEGLFHGGKTGTTNYTEEQLIELGVEQGNYAAPDGWYVGITPQYSIASWVGYDNPYERGNYLTLNETAIPQHIYREMISYLTQDIPIVDWNQPSSVNRIEIEKYTDPIMLPGPYTPQDRKQEELFVVGKEPKEQSLMFGKYINPPTGFNAVYDQENKVINVTWDPLVGNGVFELSLNDTLLYQGNHSGFSIPAMETGTYNIRLRIVEGNSSSDTLVYTINLSTEETTDEESTSEESTSEETNEEELNQSVIEFSEEFETTTSID